MTQENKASRITGCAVGCIVFPDSMCLGVLSLQNYETPLGQKMWVLPFIPGGSDGKESACSTGDLGWIPGLGRSLGEGNGCPLQYSYMENSMDRGAWQATVHGVTKRQTQLSD